MGVDDAYTGIENKISSYAEGTFKNKAGQITLSGFKNKNSSLYH